ncbi:hypothetical protein K488DRAFT_90547 [Vararia minispora EC-137]|uniref:Uncharacterized protein n=1 Tax=Vararia minispora EC-137 TaxID=1314806 RepID=A0ACB8Q7C1_9AGAM|nr:hypothetical protein K488DRAFT_90547 [Vararia minispora EC-137]
MHRFPVEILAHIFRLAVEGSYASGHVKDTWAALHVVCRRWYEVMIGQGTIASDIRITDEHWDVEFATHLLEQSNPFAVHLTMVLHYTPRNAYTVVQLQEFLGTAMTYHCARIQSMVVGQSGVHADLKELLLRAHLPDLRHLDIGPHLPIRVILCAEDLSLQAPELTTLRIASCALLQPTPGKTHSIFPNVVKLELTGSPSPVDISDIPWDIASVIGRLPALKILVLADYFPQTPRPTSQRPVELSHGLTKIEYQSSKPASSVMELDALLLHATARRSVRLGWADPHTLVDVLSGAFSNVKQRWDPDKTLEETENETTRTAWLATSIVVDRDEDIVDLRLRSSNSKATGIMDIQVRSAGDHLAYMVACIPSNAVRELHVQGVEPLRVLWRYMKHSTSLLDLHIIGRSAEGFANTIEQDPKMFANLRHVFIGGRICQPGLVATLSSLLSALACRHTDGMTQLETLAFPEGISRQSLTLFEPFVNKVSNGAKESVSA